MASVNPFRLRSDERVYVVNLYGDLYYRIVAGTMFDPVHSCRYNARDWRGLDDTLEIPRPPAENCFIVLVPAECGRCRDAAVLRLETRWHGHETLCQACADAVRKDGQEIP